MWVFGVLLIVVFALLGVFAFCVVKESHRVVSQWIHSKKVAWGVALIPLALFIIGLGIDRVNAMVADIYLFLIVGLTKLIFYTVSKITKSTKHTLAPPLFPLLSIDILAFRSPPVPGMTGYLSGFLIISISNSLRASSSISSSSHCLVNSFVSINSLVIYPPIIVYPLFNRVSTSFRT